MNGIERPEEGFKSRLTIEKLQKEWFINLSQAKTKDQTTLSSFFRNVLPLLKSWMGNSTG